MLDVLTPTPQFIIPMVVPYGGEMMDAMGFNVFPKSSLDYFEKFCRQILRTVLFLLNFSRTLLGSSESEPGQESRNPISKTEKVFGSIRFGSIPFEFVIHPVVIDIFYDIHRKLKNIKPIKVNVRKSKKVELQTLSISC